MNLHLLSDFLRVVKMALRDPTDKAAAKISIDGLTAWEAIAGLPVIQQLEADVAAYVALLPPPSQPASPPAPPKPSIILTQGGHEIDTSGGASG